MEVYLHNPWLNYGIGLHRIREAGLGTDLMDELDEKPFTLEQIRTWCIEFFVGRSNMFIRHPTLDWEGFIEDLEFLLKREKQIWNPIKNKLGDWVDSEKLLSMYRKHTRTVKHTSPLEKKSSTGARNMEPPEEDEFKPASIQRQIPNRKQRPLAQSMQTGFVRSETMPSNFRNSTREPSESRSSPLYKSVPCTKGSSFHVASGSERPGFTRRTTYNGEDCPHDAPQTYRKSASFEFLSTNIRKPQNLEQMIKNWSHRAGSLRSLETLLIEIPILFPPINPFVEKHEYFDKYKEFSADAFEGQSGDELKELLTRAVRKAKFFLHPDKLPQDLTVNQSLVLKSIWDVVQESEETTLN